MSTQHDLSLALPEYDIEGEAGAGEYGRVWRARHVDLDRKVAIKQLLVGATPTDVARFRREARLLARIDHPHVVRVFDYRESGELRLLVMELLTGGTLADRRTAGISVDDAITATIAAAHGLQVVHDGGILHRDVKPQNLVFDEGGSIKVTDFGIAHAEALDATARDLPVPGALVGTPAYLSPEQAAWALGERGPSVDARSDQYSLAATLFELLTGRLTHDSAGGALALCERRAHEAPRSVRAFGVAVPGEVEAVLMRALARDPDDRYATCAAFAAALAVAPSAAGGRSSPSDASAASSSGGSPAVGGPRPVHGDETSTLTTPLPARVRRDAEAAFAGRHGERDHWAETWKAVRAGDLRVWLVGGEAGVGKSALVSQLARHAHDDGGTVLYGRCLEDLGVPYQPWIEVLTSIVAQAPTDLLSDHVAARGGELARLVPLLTTQTGVSAPEPSDAEADRYALFGAVLDLLSRVGSRTPTTVVLEDLHWADQPTVQLLRQVIAAMDPMGLAILATYRPTDLDVGHPLTAAFAPLRREPAVEFIDLPGLSDLELLEVMEAVAGRPLEPAELALRDAILTETGGNAFFALEILRHLGETGALGRGDRGWTATPDLVVHGLPVSVRQVVGERVARLGSDVQRLLRTAAIIGREFDLGLLAEVAELDVDDVLDQLDVAVAAALVNNVGPDRYMFAHALVEHALYESLNPSRRARVHRRIAEALETGDDRGDDDVVTRLAHHWASALVPDDATKAIESAQRAGEHALAKLAPEEAIRWFTKALQLQEAHGSDERTLTTILVGLGDAQRQVNEPAHRATLLSAAAKAMALGDPDLLVAAALANGRGWASATGTVDQERLAVIEAALEMVGPGDSVERVHLLARLVAELTFDGDLARRRAAADEAEAMARRLGDERALLAALIGLLTLPCRHDTDHLRWSDEAIDLAAALDDPVALAVAAASAATSAAVFGDRVRFDRAVVACETSAGRVVDPVLRWRAVGARALQAILDGALERAETLLASVFSEGVELDYALLWYGSMIMTIRAHQGRGAEIREMVATVARGTHGGSAAELATAALSLADLQAGDETAARRDFAEQRRRGFEAIEDSLWLTHVCIDAHVCARLGARESAEVLRRMLEPSIELIAAGPSICLFSVASSAGMLAALLGDHDDADRLFALAVDRTTALRAPYLVATAQLEWAHALVDRPSPESGRAAGLLAAAVEAARAHGYGEIERRATDLAAVIGARS